MGDEVFSVRIVGEDDAAFKSSHPHMVEGAGGIEAVGAGRNRGDHHLSNLAMSPVRPLALDPELQVAARADGEMGVGYAPRSGEIP